MKTGLRLLPWLLAAALWGCTRGSTDVARGDRDQVLYRGIGYEVTGLDPQVATGTAEQAIDSELFEGLVTEDPRDLHPVPGVAKSWRFSPDGLSCTFDLRPDARWSNGEPVTARDFVDSWRRIAAPALGAPYASQFQVLRKAEALDAHTLRVTLAHPTPHFLALLTTMPWLPVNCRSIAAQGPLDAPGNPWARPGRLVGNGPFVLQSWRPDSVIVLAKSPTYWDAASVRLNGIRFYPIDSVDAEERAFRSGQLHVTDALPISKIDDYRRNAPQLLRIDPYLGTYFYRVNVRKPYLGDPRLRRALGFAIDRRAIVERILRGGQQPAGAFIPPGIDGYSPAPGFDTDYDKATRLLKEDGHPGGRGLPIFDLLYNNSENHRMIAEAVQQMWQTELGIRVRLVNEEEKTALAARQAGDYQIMRSDWIADYPDPSSFLDIWRSDSGNNQTGWSSPEYDAALSAAERTPDSARRNALYRKAEAILLEAAPILPIYYYTHVFLIRPSVQGWYPNLLDHHPCKYVWLSD